MVGKAEKPTLIVGAGLAGLACALTVRRAGRTVLLFDREEVVGGRVRTDGIEGYRLDRGFQVLLTAYPEARRFLNFEELDLRSCYPGSRVWFENRFHRVADPFRKPVDGLGSLFNPIGSLPDKLRVGLLRLGLLSTRSMPDEVTTSQALERLGFGSSMTDRFWKPFMRGVFLENGLRTSVRKFEETFRLFAEGETALPRLGIGEIPKQMARSLPSESLRLGHSIVRVGDRFVESADGKRWEGRTVVLATESEVADQLLGLDADEATPWNSVDCLYFSMPSVDLPTNEPILHLDGSGVGPINNLTFLSSLSNCAPEGRALASASIIGQGDRDLHGLTEEARGQLVSWFGKKADSWDMLKAYRIERAVPACPKPLRPEPFIRGVHRCGDHFGLPSIDSALRSGRETAERILGTGSTPG